MAIATDEPTSLRAGDTWRWRREDLSDYPASSYALVYRFKNASGGFEVTADADGDLFDINIPASVTEGYASGDYAWQAQVDGTDGKFTVDSGTLKVLPTLFSGTASAALDTRSHARRALDAINAAIEGRATHVHREYEIRVNESWRRVLDTTYDDLIKAKTYYEGLVASEQAAEDTAAGGYDRRRTYIRFGCR